MNRPTAWEIERKIAGLIYNFKLSRDEAEALDYATRHARDISEAQRGRIVAAYLRALKLDHTNYEFHEALLGYHLYAGQNELLNHRALEELAQALPYGERATALNPVSAEAAFDMGETCRHMYDRLTRQDLLNLVDESAYEPADWYKAEARRWYSTAIRLHPQNGIYREGYGKFLMLTGELRSARAQFEKGVEIFAEKPWFQKPFEERLERIKERLKRELPAPSAPGGSGAAAGAL